jgi:hypothetical protein
MIHDPKAKNDGSTPRYILDIKLFWWFPFIEDEFGHEASYIEKVISLPFQGVHECPDYISYGIWSLVLMWTTHGWVELWILKLFYQF